MNNERVYHNKMGQDPAYLAERTEPLRGYAGDSYQFQSPSPKAHRLMEECVAYAHFHLNNGAISPRMRVTRGYNRSAILEIKRHCRELNISLLKEYLPTLRGMAKMRGYRTIENLENQNAVVV